MELVKIYECLCDRTRLRILNLLCSGPLCVCHIQEVLGESQVKISRHLNYLKTRDMVVVQREANWMIYSIPEKRSRELDANLACLQDCASEDKLIVRDNARLKKVRARLRKDDSAAAAICCGKPGKSIKHGKTAGASCGC
ncbi:metalloregulator ArsR/SmtB family transcription factor [Ereboglobus sp. PH5-10]|uniref:ArsR/SmtB family transcription factor n=1 Tax=Ereboglobus sp. PH5-10 TaxID=2940629 RepID=UPI002407447A|nr:metalloregulator ArsR/SmtB family transcription factor [Ereboglobus sp. PH5-10]